MKKNRSFPCQNTQLHYRTVQLTYKLFKRDLKRVEMVFLALGIGNIIGDFFYFSFKAACGELMLLEEEEEILCSFHVGHREQV